jgi:hypothetical protein
VGREAVYAVAELGERGVEAGGIARGHRVGDRPVHDGLAAEFFVGHVAHGDNQVAAWPPNSRAARSWLPW